MTVRLKEIGKDWQTRLRRFFDSPLDGSATPLEICQAVLDEVETKVQPLGRGQRVFPYNRVVVRLRPLSLDRPTLDAAFGTLAGRVRERLQELRCMPSSLDVKVAMLKRAPGEWPDTRVFAVDYYNDAKPTLAAPARSAQVQIVVLKGAATSRSYTFTEPVISIGRTADPTDDRGQVRRNRVTFLDKSDGITETVGRAHARLRFDQASGGYRIMDDGSSNGTTVLRGGAAIPVPSRDPRGVRIESGDEVQIGRALIRIQLQAGPLDARNGRGILNAPATVQDAAPPKKGS